MMKNEINFLNNEIIKLHRIVRNDDDKFVKLVGYVAFRFHFIILILILSNNLKLNVLFDGHIWL